MQKLGLNEIDEKPRKGFWRRQFQKDATEAQRNFDWLFGVVLPVVCFVVDPIVFKNEFTGESLLGTFKPFAYVLSYVSVMATAAWLIWGAKLKFLNGFLAGVFAVGGAVSLAGGIILLPFSLLGLILLIGILGFTPLFTALVFLRNAVRAFGAAKPFFERRVLINTFMLSAVFSFCLPAVLNIQIIRSLDKIVDGDAADVRAQAANLKYVAPLVNFNDLVKEYTFGMSNRDEEKHAALAEAYRELTGENIVKAGFKVD
jgi:hypothetical protein